MFIKLNFNYITPYFDQEFDRIFKAFYYTFHTFYYSSLFLLKSLLSFNTFSLEFSIVFHEWTLFRIFFDHFILLYNYFYVVKYQWLNLRCLNVQTLLWSLVLLTCSINDDANSFSRKSSGNLSWMDFAEHPNAILNLSLTQTLHELSLWTVRKYLFTIVFKHFKVERDLISWRYYK